MFKKRTRRNGIENGRIVIFHQIVTYYSLVILFILSCTSSNGYSTLKASLSSSYRLKVSSFSDISNKRGINRKFIKIRLPHDGLLWNNCGDVIDIYKSNKMKWSNKIYNSQKNKTSRNTSVEKWCSYTHNKIKFVFPWNWVNRKNALNGTVLIFLIIFITYNFFHFYEPMRYMMTLLGNIVIIKELNKTCDTQILKRLLLGTDKIITQNNYVKETTKNIYRPYKIKMERNCNVLEQPLFCAKIPKLIAYYEIETLIIGITRFFRMAFGDLYTYLQGPRTDTLLLLLTTSLITPLSIKVSISPILGFLVVGMLIGPNALGLISSIHLMEKIADLGIVFFLFEMGIELSFERLLNMRKDVFGLGLSQFSLTALSVAAIGSLFHVPRDALLVLGGGIALSSSAFVLQLLKTKNQLETQQGKASFGVLLFQDLAVVPLLIVIRILGMGGQGLALAFVTAFVKAIIAFCLISFIGRYFLTPFYKLVAQGESREAFLSLVLLTVLSMSFITEGLGLSNTLGAFLAGVLLSESNHKYQVEADISTFRGILLGLFFVTVGFEIDFNLIISKFLQVNSIVAGVLLVKALIITFLGLSFGLSLSTSQYTGIMLSQGGEFSFVAFGLARSLGIFDTEMTKLMLTCMAITMAVTPFLSTVGEKVSSFLETENFVTTGLEIDFSADENNRSDYFVVVIGYGTLGKVVCDLLDKKLINHICLETDRDKVIDARSKGVPLHYGDIGKLKVVEAMRLVHAKAVIITISDKDETDHIFISLRKIFPALKILSLAQNGDHADFLEFSHDVIAFAPCLYESNMVRTLPFIGTVLKYLGTPHKEAEQLLDKEK